MPGISRSGFYEADRRAPSARAVCDEVLAAAITRIHHASRATYGAPRVHAELRRGPGIRCGRERVARLMRDAGPVGVRHRRKRRGGRPCPRRTRTWCEGRVYCCPTAPALDVFTRQVVGWSIADHMRSELVVDALEMARRRRRPAPGTIVHADRGSQYISWSTHIATELAA